MCVLRILRSKLLPFCLDGERFLFLQQSFFLLRVEGACVCFGKSISLVSLSAMSGKRSSGYVKDNDVRYGLKVVHRDPKSSKVIGLQCCFCIAFGREEKIGLKRKAATTVQGWSHPFRYDNIENHLRNQHSGQWAVY